MRVSAVTAVLLVLAVAPAGAQECQPKIVKARGGPSLLEATAKSRSRSAWIKKVRSEKHLGPEYAAWLRAKDPTYTCRKTGRRITCDASAAPCRVALATPAPAR